ncbi:FecR domain-containing protein [Dyadobacter sp. LHD-138]|uniref:FecR family protein n=1 Tax=Dyadobacter sp. LHD-138 TaxID=3071413 RepID=UPI0027DEAEF8|nr:FecR domain-containing protein [Dyadobacter sp. LHD-138]MDQ6480599.1 FecR domain-containing protein [Dyadobacter sp. LHD-138]
MENPVTKRLLFDFFSEKTTVIQRKLIEEWLSSPENQEMYYQYLDEWESKNLQFFPDSDKAMQHYMSQMTGGNTERSVSKSEIKLQKKSRLDRWCYTLIAASVFIAAFVTFKKELMWKSLKSGTGSSSAYVLTDGTRVLLNANSTLWIPRFGFGSESREVELEGEADFDVKHTRSNNRFVVNMGDRYRIEVLGTQFVAYSRARGKRVFLSRGQVKVQLPEGKQVYMKPGNLFASGPNCTFDVTVPDQPQKYTAWKEQLFYFDNTTLSDVSREMRERFDIDVRVSDTVLMERRIGGIYRAEHPDDLLLILSDLLKVEVIQNQDHIELRSQTKQ